MFAIKVISDDSFDYAMYSARDYEVRLIQYPSPPEANAENHLEKVIFLDVADNDQGAGIIQTVTVENVAYVMNANGKTVDTIFSNKVLPAE